MIGLFLAAAALAEANTQCSDRTLNANPGTMLHLRLKDAVSVPESAQASPNIVIATSSKRDTSSGKAPDGYVRLVIEYAPCADTDPLVKDRDYHGESRWWGKRMFAHKVVGKILKVTATVRPLGVTSTKPLSSLTLNSGKSGEVWNTTVENDSVLLPYFRNVPNAYVDLQFEFKSTRDYAGSSFTGTALDIISRATALIAPTATLVTSENKARFNDATKFVDSTISGLLKVEITEAGNVGVELTGGQQHLATVTLYEPGANDPYPRARFPNRYLGQWTISAEPLNNSVFGRTGPDGKLISDEVSAASIMNFKVDDNKSLKEALTGVSSVQSARDALLNAKDGTTGDAAIALCRAVARETDRLAFSPTDVGYAVWAYFNDLALPEAKKAALNSCVAVDHYFNPTISTVGAAH